MDAHRPASRGTVIRWCWIPVALWIATLLYLKPYDGWGAWAAAPLLLPALLLSAVMGGLGLLRLCRVALREKRTDVPLLVATVVAAIPVLYYSVRWLLRG